MLQGIKCCQCVVVKYDEDELPPRGLSLLNSATTRSGMAQTTVVTISKRDTAANKAAEAPASARPTGNVIESSSTASYPIPQAAPLKNIIRPPGEEKPGGSNTLNIRDIKEKSTKE